MMNSCHVNFASLSLDSYSGADIICGINGLPPTPNSIRIIGEFKARIESVDHINLTRYVECFRNKNERVTLVFENPSDHFPKDLEPRRIVRQLLDALDHLHKTVDCIHGLITSDSIVWSGNTLKLAHWPINSLTNGGLALGAINLLPPTVSFIAPELVKQPEKQATQESDIWSAGLVLLKLLIPDCKIPFNPCRLAFCDSPASVLSSIESVQESVLIGTDVWREFFHRALDPNPESRACIKELYSILHVERPQQCLNPFEIPLDPLEFEKYQDQLENLSISELYHLWRLSIGRNFGSDQKSDDCPPIFKIPLFILSEKQNNPITEFKLKPHVVVNTRPKPISFEKFKTDMGKLDEKIFHPLILTDDDLLSSLIRTRDKPSTDTVQNECNNPRAPIRWLTFADFDDLSLKSTVPTISSQGSETLPIIIKEADFAYQCERIIRFRRLLAGCPYLENQLKKEATIDIPPYFRAQTWALLLNVSPVKSEVVYANIVKTTPVATDRQISVDIPRCHQYNELMASPQGHQKLARILKAWLNYNSAHYVYWQGLDSLAAPFLLLNFDNEAMAFACFDAFVNKYLNGFFKKDNHPTVQRYLSMFSELLLYHDGLLANHLERLGFLPDLYAIPWFLTMFTHVLPLHKILHVWDRLLLGDERFPLCIGLAILNQLRPELMDYNFNDCIVAFSDLPEIDIERCIRDASHFYNSTPRDLINLTPEIQNGPSVNSSNSSTQSTIRTNQQLLIDI